MNEQIEIPRGYWRKLDASEIIEIARTCMLNKKQCALLWRMTERQSAPPESAFILINIKDLTKSFGKSAFVPVPEQQEDSHASTSDTRSS